MASARKQTKRRAAPHAVSGPRNGGLRARVAMLELEIRRLTQAQGDVEAERDEYVDLYHAAPIPAVTLDLAYTVRRANRAAAQFFGEDIAGIVGRSFRGLVEAHDRAAFAAALARSSEGKVTEKFRVLIDLSSRPALPVQIWARFAPLRGVFELRLLDLRDEVRAAEETRRLAEAARTAHEASAAKDKFIAVLSHELRTPLTPVLVAAAALRAKSPPGPIRDTFEMIERNITAEARLIDDLLDVNRIVRNKMQVSCRTSDVHEIVEEAVANLRPDAEAKTHRTRLELAARRHFARVDPLRLRQVFMNLLKNAIKFTPPGGCILVRSWDSGPNVVVEVEDTGVGIEQHVMAELFEAFMEDRSDTAAGGLGLGLAISRGLVELQGGKISAHSQGKHRGARFLVELPSVVPEPRAEAAAEPRKSEPPRSERGLVPRVLLVDDHVDTAQILTEFLTDSGYSVETVGSVKAAQAVNLDTVDVIVSDIGLPDGSGFDLMRDLRSRTDRPAIALTGFGMEADVRAAAEAGFDVHLTKPVDITRLLSTIEALNRRAIKHPLVQRE
jgi:signal transduction histidine kinase/ActR/RegA family two-component response regulator